jgi:hypothetical protein
LPQLRDVTAEKDEPALDAGSRDVATAKKDDFRQPVLRLFVVDTRILIGDSRLIIDVSMPRGPLLQCH